MNINLRVRGSGRVCVWVCSRRKDPFISVVSDISDMFITEIIVAPYHSRILSRDGSRAGSARKHGGKLLEIIFGNVFISIIPDPPYCIICGVYPYRARFCGVNIGSRLYSVDCVKVSVRRDETKIISLDPYHSRSIIYDRWAVSYRIVERLG